MIRAVGLDQYTAHRGRCVLEGKALREPREQTRERVSRVPLPASHDGDSKRLRRLRPCLKIAEKTVVPCGYAPPLGGVRWRGVGDACHIDDDAHVRVLIAPRSRRLFIVPAVEQGGHGVVAKIRRRGGSPPGPTPPRRPPPPRPPPAPVESADVGLKLLQRRLGTRRRAVQVTCPGRWSFRFDAVRPGSRAVRQRARTV